jgi:hypothetical protein
MNNYKNLSLGIWISVGLLSGIEANCNLCGDRPIPNDGLLHEKHGISCRNLFDELTYMEGGTQECDRIQLAAYQTGCCDEQYVPENVCSVCPDGSPFRTSVSIPGSPERRELTCADIPSEGSFLDFFTTPGDCSDTFLQRSAAWCQCPGHEVECHLCPKGAAPADLEKTENVLYGWNCKSFQYVTALLKQGECAVSSHILDFDATAFCCEGVEPPDICDFCPVGQEVVNPDKTIATQYGFVKCGDIEESLRMIPTPSSCDFVKQSINSDMCCGVPGASSAIRTDFSLASSAILLLTSIYLF